LRGEGGFSLPETVLALFLLGLLAAHDVHHMARAEAEAALLLNAIDGRQ